jgi:ComF family protein
MLKGAVARFLNIIYPKTCIACSKPLGNNAIDSLLCTDCWQGIERNIPPLCAICGRQIRESQISRSACKRCQRQSFSFDRSFSPCIYEGIIRELIHKFKYQNKEYLSSILAKLLIEFIYQYRITLDNFDLIMPVPLHAVRLREREFNQAELIAREIALKFSLPLSSSNLWRKSNRPAQMELNEEERWKNVRDCFALRNPSEVKEKNIILIDDVITTGATCSEVASVLKKFGSGSVWVLTLAN